MQIKQTLSSEYAALVSTVSDCERPVPESVNTVEVKGELSLHSLKLESAKKHVSIVHYDMSVVVK